MNDSTLDLETSIKNLQACRRKLKNIDEDELDSLEPATQEEWAKALQLLSVNINKLTTAQLITLNEKFLKREPELRIAAGRLEKDVGNLNNAVQIIRAVSAGLGVITNIVGLIGRVA